MAKFYRSIIKLGDIDREVIQIQHENTPQKSNVKINEAINHIHIIDRSGSMWNDINYLIEQVKMTLTVIPTTDFITLAWFSGTGQYSFPIKGMRPNDPALLPLLNSLKSTVGCTCFSEVLASLDAVLTDMTPLTSLFNITLFTDGQPMVPWSDEEESRRVMTAIAKIKGRVLGINTVGYRYDYDKEFLRAIASQTEFGVATHSANIAEYLDIFQHNYEVINDLCNESVAIEAPQATIVYLNRKFSKMAKDEFKLARIDKEKNNFFILAPLLQTNKPWSFKYNGTLYTADTFQTKTPKIIAANEANLAYALIANNYYNGDRREALEIAVKSVHDKTAADLMMNAFTLDETQATQKELNKFVIYPSKRGKDKCDDAYIPDKKAFCAMDLFTLLAMADNYYIPSKDYQRTGLKTTDNFNIFKHTNTPPAHFSDFVFSKDRLNLSIRFTINGEVTLNPRIAGGVGLPAVINATMFRTHTIILDGNLNMEKLRVKLDACTNAVLKTKIANRLTAVEGETMVYDIDLKGLPIINAAYAESGKDTMNIVKLLWLQYQQEAEVKVLRGLLPAESKTVTTVYNAEQLEVLKQHGLNEYLWYGGVDNKTEKATEETDFYYARTLELVFKGMATIPSFNALMEYITKNKKANNPIVEYMLKFYNENKGLTFADLNAKLKTVKAQLMTTRMVLASIKLSKILTFDFFSDTIVDAKGAFTYQAGDKTLLIKPDREKIYYSK